MTEWIYFLHPPRDDFAATMTEEERAAFAEHFEWLARLMADGVLESDGAIEEGQYAFWGHEHLFGKHNISGFQDTVGAKIFSGVQTTLGTAGSVPSAHSPGIALQYMHCDKSSDVAYPARN